MGNNMVASVLVWSSVQANSAELTSLYCRALHKLSVLAPSQLPRGHLLQYITVPCKMGGTPTSDSSITAQASEPEAAFLSLLYWSNCKSLHPNAES